MIINPYRQHSILWQSEMLTAFSKSISNFKIWFLSWVLGSFSSFKKLHSSDYMLVDALQNDVGGFWS